MVHNMDMDMDMEMDMDMDMERALKCSLGALYSTLYPLSERAVYNL